VRPVNIVTSSKLGDRKVSKSSGKDKISISPPLCSVWFWGRSTPGEIAHCILGPQSRSGHYGEEENPLFMRGIELRFLRHPARGLISISTELCVPRYFR
jgi:hypothetical protein